MALLVPSVARELLPIAYGTFSQKTIKTAKNLTKYKKTCMCGTRTRTTVFGGESMGILFYFMFESAPKVSTC